MDSSASILFFDFDGVIADSFSLSYSIMQRLNANVSEDEYRKKFEGNIIANHYEEGYTDDDLTVFADEYSKGILSKSLFDGIAHQLNMLSGHHTKIIVSSAPSDPVVSYLSHHDLSHHFSDVLGGDVHPSKVEKIIQSLAKYNTPAGKCLFITDTLGDIHEAHRAGIPTLAVSWGFHSSETLERGNPARIIHSPHHLSGSVQDLLMQYVAK